jgi:hypothetical protein
MRRLLAASALAIGASLAAGAAQALTIVPTFDSSITDSSNAAAIEANIDNALQFYDTTFSNPETVQIDFQISSAVAGGESETSFYQLPAAAYVDYLPRVAAASPQNAVLQSAAAFAASGNFSTRQNWTLFATAAELSAIGLNAPGQLDASGGTSGSFDGIVTVNSGLSFTDTAGPGGVNATAIFEHEIDEVLGIGGAGSLLDDQQQFPNTLGVLDLYRYSGPGTPSFTTATNATSYLSFNGGQSVVGMFNQTGVGDAGDWADFTASCSGALVQNYTECQGNPVVSLNRASPEVVALEGVGYNLGVPEPATWALLLTGFALIGTTLRRPRYRLA